jgi:hypothetical protein
MSSLVFSLDLADPNRAAQWELARSGLDPRRVRYFDRFSYLPDAANDDDVASVERALPAELHREVAQGRVLVEIEVGDDTRPALERLVKVLGPSARTFVARNR